MGPYCAVLAALLFLFSWSLVTFIQKLALMLFRHWRQICLGDGNANRRRLVGRGAENSGLWLCMFHAQNRRANYHLRVLRSVFILNSTASSLIRVPRNRSFGGAVKNICILGAYLSFLGERL